MWGGGGVGDSVVHCNNYYNNIMAIDSFKVLLKFSINQSKLVMKTVILHSTNQPPTLPPKKTTKKNPVTVSAVNCDNDISLHWTPC